MSAPVQEQSITATERFVAQVREACGTTAIAESELERRVLAHDASHYLLQPQAVVRPQSAEHVGSMFAAAARHGLGLTLRSGGTSLSGQAVTDQVLVDTRRHFRDVEVLDNGARVRVQPGVTIRQVNARLVPTGTSWVRIPRVRPHAPWAVWWPTTHQGWRAAPSSTPTAPWNP